MPPAFLSPNREIALSTRFCKFRKHTIFPNVLIEFKIRLVREKACINPIKVLVLLVNHLLEKEASCANRIIDEYRPVFPGKEAYFQTIDGLKKEWTAVAYHEDGNIELRI